MNAAAPEGHKNAVEAEELLCAYKLTGGLELRNELVLHYSYIARVVAVEMRNTFCHYATVEEMINQGIIAIIESIERFDPAYGVKFSTLAFIKVRGAIVDYVRGQDWRPRRVWQNSMRAGTAWDELTMEYGRTPTREEMAAQLQMTPETFDRCVCEILGGHVLSYEAVFDSVVPFPGAEGPHSDPEHNPEGRLDDAELYDVLTKEIERLNEQERAVLSMYYSDELTLREISRIMGLTEQRIGQINRKLVMKLRIGMLMYMHG